MPKITFVKVMEKKPWPPFSVHKVFCTWNWNHNTARQKYEKSVPVVDSVSLT